MALVNITNDPIFCAFERNGTNMAKSKKTRKVGQIGIPKSKDRKVSKITKQPKTKKGKVAGNRQNPEREINKRGANTGPTNPKVGSKTKIDLSKYENTGQAAENNHSKVSKKQLYKAELHSIENDKKLDALLDKQEQGELNKSDAAYVKQKSERYAFLCKMLGIEEDIDTEDTSNDDPYAQLDAINLNDYKD